MMIILNLKRKIDKSIQTVFNIGADVPYIWENGIFAFLAYDSTKISAVSLNVGQLMSFWPIYHIML